MSILNYYVCTYIGTVKLQIGKNDVRILYSLSKR